MYSSAGYVTAMQEAIPRNPYCVKYLNHSFFKDYSSVTYRTSIRPGNKAGDPQVHDLVALKYNLNGSVQYKTAFDEEWAELPQRERTVTLSITPHLYDTPLKISNQKYEHLQQLKRVIPSDNLPHM